MNAETFFIYMFYGAFFAFSLLLYSKSYVFRGNGQLSSSVEKISAKTTLLPFLFFVFISFIIFTVFRDESVGADYGSYEIFFHSAAGNKLSEYIVFQMAIGGEPLYSLVSYIIYSITDNFLVFLFIINLTIFLTQIKLFSKTKNFWLSFVIYLILFFPMIFESFNIMRNCLAAFIAIWGYAYLDKKKYFAAVLAFFAATLVHYTAMFCFTVWVMSLVCNGKVFRLKRLFLLVFVGTIATYLLLPRLIDIILAIKPVYSYHVESGGGLAIKSLSIYVVVFAVSLIYSKKLIAHNPFNKIMIIVLGCALIIAPLQLLVNLIARMMLFSQIALFFLVYEIFSVVKITRKNLFPAVGALALIALLSLGWFYSHVKNIPKDYGIDNYKSMLF